MSKVATVALALGFVFVAFSGQCYGASPPLKVGFYQGKCNGTVDVEVIVGGVVKTWFSSDSTITPALLRMQFHDCFVTVRSFFFFIYIFYLLVNFSLIMLAI